MSLACTSANHSSVNTVGVHMHNTSNDNDVTYELIENTILVGKFMK